MRKKLVQFADGKFGVRYGLFFFRFQDFKHPHFTWGIDCRYIGDCKTDEATARAFFGKRESYTVIESY